MQRRIFIGVIAAMVATGALAEERFPSKPLTLIVPYAGGSSSDAQARIFADQLSKSLGQSVVVENKPGANAAIGMHALKVAPADGHTIGMAGGSPMVINPFVTKSLNYDPDDFIHVRGIAQAPAAFVVGQASPYKTLAEAAAAAKAERRPINIGTYAAIYELAVTALALQSGSQTQNVSYKGAGNVISDLIGGHLEMGFIDISGALPLIRDGQLRVLGLASSTRPEALGQVPLVSDTYPGFEMTPWTSFVVRKETPAGALEKLEAALGETHDSAQVKNYFQESGLIPLNFDHAQMQRFQEEEKARYQAIVSKGNIQPR
ncbi:tripartite tricarboxylate transporter substrate binding protein [Verticiella sediminum]|uniref:Tripartite tricarboxylate transporter substrate binding protein n=1 Tax=Verticiella sediminum TaxID=1247510 RepID=A0A556AZM2_9BURK|nr:tripartite tricarboxylate transporter substrate binding protein [Verticiella sediminum]TSH98366.1 tripartite tricarboxylate transporter substrate binding protein [Verticiella sediminum]